MNKKLYKLMNWPMIEGVVYAEETNPYLVLGARETGASTLFQTFIPDADSVSVIVKQSKEEKEYPMESADESGFFAALIPGRGISKYEYEIKQGDKKWRIKDAYSIKGYEIKGEDAKKLSAGNHNALYKIMGAVPMSIGGISGVRFAVWAPEAVSVSVAGSFNDFKSGMYPMKRNDELGIFELFIPDVIEGDTYVYEVKVKGGGKITKLDPFTKKSCLLENTSVVFGSAEYEFGDSEWIKKRGAFKKADSPVSIYELFPGNFIKASGKNELPTYKELSESIIKYVKDEGFTHICLMPLSEYLSDESLGFKTTGFYAPTDRYGSPDELKAFINECHKNDIGVIFNYAIADFDNDELGLSAFDGTPLYEYADAGLSNTPEGDRFIFDFAKERVRDFLISNALYLILEYHIDGLKINKLSSMLYLSYGKESWIPRYNIYGGNENLEAISFIRMLTDTINKKHKDVLLLAEEVTGFPYVTGDTADNKGLGFDLKLNNGFIADYLNFICDDVNKRQYGFNKLSESMAYQYMENFVNALSYKEFINGYPSLYERMPGDDALKLSNLRLTFTYLFAHPGKKLIFEGQDIGISDTFSYERELDLSVMKKAANKGLKTLYKDLNKLYMTNKALYEKDGVSDGFEWINALPSDKCILSFLRKGKAKDDVLLVVCNFSDKEQSISVGTPYAGKYKELLNTDAKEYGGTNKLNGRNKPVSELEADGRPYSIEIKLAPCAASILKYIPFTELEKHKIAKKKEAAIAKTKASEYANEALSAENEAKAFKEAMEEARAKMKDAEARAKRAHEMENAELDRAKRALAEAE